MKTLIVALFAILVSSNAFAATYQEAVKQCGTEWKASEERKNVVKGEGRAAWNTFRAACVKRVGYETKKGKKVSAD